MRRLIFITFILIFLFCNCQKKDYEWFQFLPKNTLDAGVIGMQNWLDVPAGKHGYLQFENEKLIFEDGTEIKLWGTNICSKLPFVEAAVADSFVNFLAKYGCNAVRFHKFSWYATDGYESTKFRKDKFERLDYFQYKLKEKGIYYAWSHIYGHRVQPGDSIKMVAYEEIKNLNYPWRHLNASTSALVNFAPDLQALNIGLTVDMLNHVNPHTGLRYADDPALAFIEFQNEDDIFWGAIQESLKQAPTYKKMFCEMFSNWLLKKYKTQAALANAWGDELPKGQTLAAKNIYPESNHGMFGWEYEQAIKEGRSMTRRYLDILAFLYETQNKFYARFEKAIRETGYKGVLVGSCWQAGSGVSHFYNLNADRLVGMIDRHNYFGGGEGGHQLKEGFVKNKAMLEKPGSGLLSAGMQQVEDRPFSFSEWMSNVPNQWTAEATPIIATYGMGLQGWDASFSFATDLPRFSRLLESERHGVYNATSPLHMGLYPALARMIYRGDVKESEVLGTRHVHIPSLVDGNLGFEEYVRQDFDVKYMTGTVPSEAMAVGRFPVKYVDEYTETFAPDLSNFLDTISESITSATGELEWHYGEDDYFTINTEGTKGVVGFSGKQKIELDDWSVQTDNRFAVILISSLEKNKQISEAKEILLTAVSQGKNTGMQYNEKGDTLLVVGQMPILLEPVNMTIVFPEGDYEIVALNQDGQKKGGGRKVRNNKLTINTGKDKTIWFLIRKKIEDDISR